MQGKQFLEQVEKQGLVKVLSDNGGLLHIKNVFPQEQAQSMLETFKAIPDGAWYNSKYLERKSWSTRHSFHRHHSTRLDTIKKTLERLAPDLILSIGASRYDPGAFIEDHNDLSGDTVKESVTSSSGKVYAAGTKRVRKVAVNYYMMPEWKADNGGSFVDLYPKTPRTFVPEFNSLVVFLVPREHNVTEVVKDCTQKRHAYFGWFIGEGNMDEVSRDFEKAKKKRKSIKV